MWLAFRHISLYLDVSIRVLRFTQTHTSQVVSDLIQQQTSQGINESANFRFLQRLSVRFCFLPRLSAGRLITRTVSAGSYLPSTTVWAGSKRSRTISVEAKYDGQSLQEAKIGGLVCTLWTFSGIELLF